MNLPGDGLMLVIAPHEHGVREGAYLNASPENCATSAAFLAPPPRQSPKVGVTLLSFTGSAPIDSVASSRGWLTQKRSARQNHRPARRTVPSCTRRAGLLATRSVAPRNLAGAVETRTPQVIEAPLFSKNHVKNSPPCHSGRAFGPSKRPFTRLPLRAFGPWVRIAPPLLSGLRQTLTLRATLLDSPGEGRPRPHALRGDELAVGTRLRLGAARLLFTARACHRCPRGGWLRRTRSAGQNHRPARRTVPSCTRRAGLLASRNLPALARRFPQCRACSRWTSSPDGATIASPTHRGAPMGEHITSSSVERARRDWSPGTVLSLCSRTSTDALATSQQGLAPDPRCARAGEAQGVRQLCRSRGEIG
jgi:hypothetical protein